MAVAELTVSTGKGRRRRSVKLLGLDLYRSRPINRQVAERFPRTLYYAVHFDEESHKFAFLFLGADGERDRPDVLMGLEAQEQWSRFVDIMTRDPVISGLRVERISHHELLEECVLAARADARGMPPLPV